MARILALVLLVCVFTRAIAEDASRVIIDEKRYADLLDNPYDRRILRVVFHSGYGHAVRLTEEEQADRRWFDEQGAKAFPVLLEVIKREPSPVDSPESPDAWLALLRNRLILGWAQHFPDGNFQPFVEEVRRQVPRLKGVPNQDYLQSHFLREAFGLLAGKGDESDIHLMEQFLDDEDVGNRDSARGGIAKLKARLEAERNKQAALPKEDAVAGHKAHPTDADGSLVTKPSGGDTTVEDSSTSSWWLILAVAGAAAMGLLWILLKKRK